MSRQIATLASELLAYVIILGIVGILTNPVILTLIVANSVAGTIMLDRNNIHVPPTDAIKRNQISLHWGFRKMWSNNMWWRN